MKKEKNLSYYRNLLHKDGIALLVVAVIFTIVSFLFMLQDGYSGDLSVPIFLKSIMFIVLYKSKNITPKIILIIKTSKHDDMPETKSPTKSEVGSFSLSFV